MENKQIEERKECEIVADLLPLYFEKKTSEESNQFLESHLETCKDCKKKCDIMGSSFTEQLRWDSEQKEQQASGKRAEGQQAGRRGKARWHRKMGIRTIIIAYVMILAIIWLYCVVDMYYFFG